MTSLAFNKLFIRHDQDAGHDVLFHRLCALRSSLSFPTLQADEIIKYYNDIIQQILDVVTSPSSQQWPAHDFYHDYPTLNPPRNWNSSESFDRIRQLFESLKLPNLILDSSGLYRK